MGAREQTLLDPVRQLAAIALEVSQAHEIERVSVVNRGALQPAELADVELAPLAEQVDVGAAAEGVGDGVAAVIVGPGALRMAGHAAGVARAGVLALRKT